MPKETRFFFIYFKELKPCTLYFEERLELCESVDSFVALLEFFFSAEQLGNILVIF